MQISIQRKLSNASMLAFQGKPNKGYLLLLSILYLSLLMNNNYIEVTPEAIKSDIAKIQATIDKQISNIRDKAKALSKKSELKNL